MLSRRVRSSLILVVVLLMAAATTACGGQTGPGAKEADGLAGTWGGTLVGFDASGVYRDDFRVEVKIEKVEGSAFAGNVRAGRSTVYGPADALQGFVFTSNDIVMNDANGTYRGRLVGSNTMEIGYTEPGTSGSAAYVGSLVRE